MHIHTHSKEKKNEKRRGNSLKPLKTQIQSSRGRKECSDVFRDILGLHIYRLTRRKKIHLNFGVPTPNATLPVDEEHARDSHFDECYNTH